MANQAQSIGVTGNDSRRRIVPPEAGITCFGEDGYALPASIVLECCRGPVLLPRTRAAYLIPEAQPTFLIRNSKCLPDAAIAVSS